MARPLGQFKIYDFRWTVSYALPDGRPATKSFYNRAEADEFAKTVNGVVTVTSWQVRGTLIENGKKNRRKPVFDKFQDALDALADFTDGHEGTSRLKVQDLLSKTQAKDAISSGLPDGWSFKGTVDFAKSMGYDPNLPKKTVDEVVQEYILWLASQVKAGNQSENKYQMHRFALKMPRLYFRGESIYVLLDKERVQQFIEGKDPIPCYEEVSSDRSVPREKSTATERPWKRDSQRLVATSISSMMNSYVRGRYVGKYIQEEAFWYPPVTETDPYIMDFEEIRNLIDGAWQVAGGRHAARYVLRVFGGIRPEEIDSWDDETNKGSYLNLSEGIFYVDSRRKTGCREVLLPMNARLMLQILKFEGRLDAHEIEPGSNCYRIRYTHPGTLTYFHARLGYRVSESTVERDSQSADRFFELNPVKYEAGWIQDGPRHTCLDFYFYATNKNAGATAGYAGNLETTFYKNYKGKLRVGNIAAAVAMFYRLMPLPYRHLETALDSDGHHEIELPPWYCLKDDSAMAKRIEEIAMNIADRNLICYNENILGSRVKELNTFRLIENSWKVDYIGPDGEPSSHIFHSKQRLVEFVRENDMVSEKQAIRFPFHEHEVELLKGRIEVNSWRLDGNVIENGERIWIRPVRKNKEDALKLLAELQEKYPKLTAGSTSSPDKPENGGLQAAA